MPRGDGVYRVTRLLAILAGFALSACVTTPSAEPSLDRLARDYLALQLAIGEKDPGYVDAYYGPAELAELAEQAEKEDGATSLAELGARVNALDARLAALGAQAGSAGASRIRYLRAMLASAAVRLRMLRGEAIPFQDEAEGLFGVRPELVELATLDPVLARIEALVPGDGPLWSRVNAFQDRFVIPEHRLRAVIDAAVAECRRRTLEYVALPAGERFDLSLVTDKPWSGFNYYQGDYHSVIEINTDLPIRLDRAVDVGCHEAYPGHHVYSVLIERDRVDARGEIEYTLLPLYSPRAIVSEGSATYGRKLAFAGDEQVAYERDVLAPMAGIPTEGLADYYALREALEALAPARYTIAAGYLDGTLSREEAIALSMRYRLVDQARAEQSLRFMDTYRSYVINYGLGEELVAAHVEAAGADGDARWERFLAILSNPVLPEDLQ